MSDPVITTEHSTDPKSGLHIVNTRVLDVGDKAYDITFAFKNREFSELFSHYMNEVVRAVVFKERGLPDGC